MRPKLLGNDEEYYPPFDEKLFIFTEMSYFFGKIFLLPGFIPIKQPHTFKQSVTGDLNKSEWRDDEFWNLRTLHYQNISIKSQTFLPKVAILSN